MHEIIRNEKNLIHELSIHNHELQLKETSFKECLLKQKNYESDLQRQLCELNQQVDALEICAKKQKITERQKNAVELNLVEAEKNIVKLKNELKSVAQKFCLKTAEFKQEKVDLCLTIDRLKEKLRVTESSETNSKQKLKLLEEMCIDQKKELEKKQQLLIEWQTKVELVENENSNIMKILNKVEHDKTQLQIEMNDIKCEKVLRDNELKMANDTVNESRNKLIAMQTEKQLYESEVLRWQEEWHSNEKKLIENLRNVSEKLFQSEQVCEQLNVQLSLLQQHLSTYNMVNFSIFLICLNYRK